MLLSNDSTSPQNGLEIQLGNNLVVIKSQGQILDSGSGIQLDPAKYQGFWVLTKLVSKSLQVKVGKVDSMDAPFVTTVDTNWTSGWWTHLGFASSGGSVEYRYLRTEEQIQCPVLQPGRWKCGLESLDKMEVSCSKDGVAGNNDDLCHVHMF